MTVSTADKERVQRLLDGRPDSEELTLRQVTAILPYSYPTICRLRDNGHLLTIKKGGRYVVLVSELRRFNQEGNFDPGSSDPTIRIPEVVDPSAPLPIRTDKDGSVDLSALTPEEKARLGSEPDDLPTHTMQD